MPTYEYKCEACGLRFERRQEITADPVTECPECGGKVRLLVSGGAGFLFKGSGRSRGEPRPGACSWEQTNKTCCGRDTRCDKPACEL